MNSEVESRVSRGESDISVVFRGDGEPQSANLLLGRLAEMESSAGLDPDYYSLGGSVAGLENHFAAALGKESAIFMPTGTLANHLAIRALCGVKPRAIVQEQSHLYHDSGDCVTQLSGINLVPLARERTCFDLEELGQAIFESTAGRVVNPIGAVMIESPVRRQMGQVVPFQEMKAMTDLCRNHGIGTHLDGARLYMMSAASGISLQEYSALFDTVYVSLYKYFGAPYGGVLAGDAGLIDGMFHTRRMFGGGLASSYFAAALALQGAEGFEERFAAALQQGRDLVQRLNSLPGVEIREFDHGSNIFPLTFSPDVDTERMLETLARNQVFLYPDEGTDRITRLTVNTTILKQSNDAIMEAFASALRSS
jgi:threonine aldolase